ncbi:MAG: hypothetical protein J6X18_08530 [Bacteroidales bacterium]|nr:hypothetical protein [Bacteroidales bacterium]
MKLTYDDYMKLDKERLAQLLVEKDAEEEKKVVFPWQPALGGNYNPPCYAPDGVCSNPFHDCINCPKNWYTGGTMTSNAFQQTGGTDKTVLGD